MITALRITIMVMAVVFLLASIGEDRRDYKILNAAVGIFLLVLFMCCEALI